MKTNPSEAAENPSNIVTLPTPPRSLEAKPKSGRGRIEAQFKIKGFTNASGSESWRVDGYKRDGTRVRQNFTDQLEAQAAQLALEEEFLGQVSDTALRATKLTDTQLKIAEIALIRLGNDQELLSAVDNWIKTGRPSAPVDSRKLDEAVSDFKEWLATADFRSRTKANLKTRVNIFANSVPNLRLASITQDTIYNYLEKRNVGRSSKDNDRRALSRFFVYCMDRPRKWIAINPARKENRERRTNGTAPVILHLEDCAAILKAAEKHRRGRLAPYVATCLFGGLRPFEAARLRLDQINLGDGEIRLEAEQTKTKTGRVVTVCKTLKAWLAAYTGKPIYPPNWRRDFDLIKAAAGFGNPKRLPKAIASARDEWRTWPDDVLRHTGVSHFFRRCGSYGLTAEWAGNSERIIKAHYQGRVSSEDTKKFYRLMPKKGGRK